MIRKNLIKSLSVVMAAMLAMMTVACGANTAKDETAQIETTVETEEEKDLESSLLASTTAHSTDSEVGKVETVYVKADANGAVNDVVVSEWLKNAEASDELSDTTELKDIVNVKGSETFTDNGDGTLTWNASGADIYYQGTTDKELPVKMNITYTLNGKEISPEELAGKSGKVTIRFDYENTAKQTVDVDGKEIEVYTPFAMVSGMMLDADKFANVEISNGKVISDGGNYIVMGVAVPGLKESLDISDEKWDELDDEELQEKLSNHFEITADTSDFELGMTITMASSDILSDFGLTDLSDSNKVEDIKDDMGELSDGSTQLVDGTKTLKDGTTELRDGVSELYDGTKELKDGTQSLYDGTGSLKDGTSALADGSGSLYDGVKAYTEGASKINDGASQLATGAKSAKDGSAKLVAGTKAAQEGAATLASGATQVNAGVTTLINNLNTMTEDTVKALNYKETCLNAAKAYLTGTGELNNYAIAGLTEVGLTAEQAEKIKSDNASAVQTLTDSIDSKTEEIKSTSDTIAQNYKVSGKTYEEGNVVEVETGTIEKTEEPEIATGNETVTEPATTTESETVTEPKEESEDVKESSVENGTANATGNDGSNGSAEEVQPSSQSEEKTQPSEEGQTETSNENSITLDTATLATYSTMSVTPDMLGASLYTENEYNTLKDNYDSIKADYEIMTNKSQAQQDLINSILGYLSDGTISASVQSAITAVATYNSYISAIDSALTTLNSVKSALPNTTIDGTTASQLKLLIKGCSDLQGGTALFSQKMQELYAGTSQLDSGLGQLSSGANTLSEGTSTLVSNNDKLVDGAYQLSDGARALDTGAGELRDGAGKLNDGAGKLNDGASALNDGAIELDDGVQELLDGVIKLDEEGIQKIYEVFDGDFTEFADKMTAIQKAGESYTTFGGAEENVDSSVKFIIKTDSIKSL